MTFKNGRRLSFWEPAEMDKTAPIRTQHRASFLSRAATSLRIKRWPAGHGGPAPTGLYHAEITEVKDLDANGVRRYAADLYFGFGKDATG